MKLLLREHIPLILVYLAQNALTLLIFWLNGYRDLRIAFYALFLSLCLLIGYFCYRFVSLRFFYRRLTQPLETLDESADGRGFAPLAEALNQLLQTQYQHFQKQIHQTQRKLNDHITFINQWVHQMKTPLSVINLTIEREDGPVFESIREETERMEKGLQTVLYTARLDTFEQDFQVEQVTLSATVKKVISENKRLFIRNHVYPEVKVDDHLQVETDEKWLVFMLGQLVTNAVRYSAGTGEKVTVSSSLRGSHVVLEVRDRGVGIPKQDIRRVFEPYFTGENGRTYRESTGMGLYLVREVCKRLGHEVELESEVGVGTAVRIIFREQVPNLTKM